jgi:hypothetical protein
MDNTYRDEDKLDIDVAGVAVKRLPPVVSLSYIHLTPEFDKRSPEDQKVFLWSLCSSMNQALDTMQRERNQVLEEILPAKEKLVIQLQKQNTELSAALSTHVQKMNDAANTRAAELHGVKQVHAKAMRDLQRKCDDLEARAADHGVGNG